jgi:methylthioribose-1-phosphate isomerase
MARRADDHDPSRREFFRTFSRDAVRQAGAVAGAAAELRRATMAAAGSLFDPEAPTTDSNAVAVADLPESQVDESQPDATFRSAYRFTGSQIIALDARQLPDRVATVALTAPSEVASAIRAGAINAGPVLGEVGAYALAMAARAAVARPDAGRDQQVRAAANTLRYAKAEVRALAWAIDRVEAAYRERTGHTSDPTDLADRVASEADSIASGNAVAHAEIGRIGASAVMAEADGALNLLMHGDMGPLSCGMVGLGTSLIQNARDAGREVHVWVTEAAPSGEGRVCAYQLRQLDVPVTVIADSAVAWTFGRQRIDALLLRGDQVGENGSCGVLIGGLAAAIVAKREGVPVFVLAPRSAYGPAVTSTDRPTNDVLTPDLVTRVVTEAL